MKQTCHRLNRRPRSRSVDGCGSSVFAPMIDYYAKQHRRFDELMNDKKHREKMRKVTLPKVTLKEPKW